MAYEKLNHLIFTYKVVTWHCVDVSLLSYFSQSVLFFFSNNFIASLSLHASPTLSSYIPLSIYLFLNLSFTLRIAIILLLFLDISLSLSLSVSLAQPLTIVLLIFATLFPSFFHSYYDMIIIIIVFVLIIIISLLVLLLANMKINILEKYLFAISDDFLYFSLFLHFFIFASPLNIYFW